MDVCTHTHAHTRIRMLHTHMHTHILTADKSNFKKPGVRWPKASTMLLVLTMPDDNHATTASSNEGKLSPSARGMCSFKESVANQS